MQTDVLQTSWETKGYLPWTLTHKQWDNPHFSTTTQTQNQTTVNMVTSLNNQAICLCLCTTNTLKPSHQHQCTLDQTLRLRSLQCNRRSSTLATSDTWHQCPLHAQCTKSPPYWFKIIPQDWSWIRKTSTTCTITQQPHHFQHLAVPWAVHPAVTFYPPQLTVYFSAPRVSKVLRRDVKVRFNRRILPVNGLVAGLHLWHQVCYFTIRDFYPYQLWNCLKMDNDNGLR